MENMSTDVSSVERVHANNYFERNCGLVLLLFVDFMKQCCGEYPPEGHVSSRC